jgi:predicted metal-dependent HD superfamily phosphohydrolase
LIGGRAMHNPAGMPPSRTSSFDPAPITGTPWLAMWLETWQLLGAQPPPGELETLLAAWAQPQRHYHDQRHLAECLAHWAAWRGLAEHPGELGLAIWYHDAVYEPQAKDNERRSTDWARRSLSAAGLGGAAAERVDALVMATCHHAPALGVDARLLSDIDLAVLGAPPERFAGYDRGVRAEYAWVPEPVYREKRREVLQQFLQRPRIYQTEPAFQTLEAQARTNLASAVDRLSGSPGPQEQQG